MDEKDGMLKFRSRADIVELSGENVINQVKRDSQMQPIEPLQLEPEESKDLRSQSPVRKMRLEKSVEPPRETTTQSITMSASPDKLASAKMSQAQLEAPSS